MSLIDLGSLKRTNKNRVIWNIQKFLRFIDVFRKFEQKLYDYLEYEAG